MLKTGKAYLTEATFDKFWASGLSVENNAKVNPDYFPGSNELGQLLMDLREFLQSADKRMWMLKPLTKKTTLRALILCLRKTALL